MKLETKIFSGDVFGIHLDFIDLINSGTPSCVFTELQRDDYGLQRIELTPDSIVIDVGANIGMFSIYVKKKFGCKVVAYEPVPVNFEHFKKNIELNGLSLSDFTLYNNAVSSKEGDIITIGTPPYNSGGSSIYHKMDHISKCETKSLSKGLLERCDYLKIDTEGSEFDIVPSILNHLDKVKYIGIEYHTLGGNKPYELHKKLKEVYKGVIFCQEPMEN